jgi:hypothetical protein
MFIPYRIYQKGKFDLLCFNPGDDEGSDSEGEDDK